MLFRRGTIATWERGINLSGGQKQRISIARALAINPKILILDDCLSGVDAKTENAIIKNISEKFSGKTFIVVTHRISAIKEFDSVNNDYLEEQIHR